ncbi:MAG: M56 family metallopeptidase [Polyangiaceae bacterium]|nr:M56 family metallopeptidase [Polyangiaceae bacterium]
MIGALLFNLTVNAVGSFVGSLAMVAPWQRAVERRSAGWGAVLFLLPPAKVLLDLIRGIPGDSFFWRQLDGVIQEVGVLQMGASLRAPLLPSIELHLGAQAENCTRSQSIAEPIAAWLSREAGASVPSLMGVALATTAGALLLRRALTALRWRRELEGLRLSSLLLETREARRQQVEVRASLQHQGAPFVVGGLHPWVCIPLSLWQALTPAEREAVVLHELAHLERLDALALGLLGVVADLCWFVPGLRAWCRRASVQIEVAADQRAVQRGADPCALASALVRSVEITRASFAPSLGLIRPGPSLSRRVHLLLAAGATAPRLPIGLPLIMLSALVLASSIFGNRLPRTSRSFGVNFAEYYYNRSRKRDDHETSDMAGCVAARGVCSEPTGGEDQGVRARGHARDTGRAAGDHRVSGGR